MVRLDHSFILSRFDLSLHSRIGCILGLVIVGSVVLAPIPGSYSRMLPGLHPPLWRGHALPVLINVAIIMSLFVFPGQCMADVSDDYLTWAEPL